jgi:hypothetical protein
MKDVAGVDDLAIDLDRHADVEDLEIAVADDREGSKVMEAERLHLSDVAKSTVGDHPDRAELLGEGRHHLAGTGISLGRATDILHYDHGRR